MNILNLVRPDLLKLQGYDTENLRGKILLNANESPFPTEFNRYPEGRPCKLRQKMSALYGVKPENITVTCGSDQAIDVITRVFCEYKKDPVLVCPPTFSMYEFYATAQGCPVVRVPLLPPCQLDVKNIIAKKPKLIFIPNPSAPLGTLFKRSDLEKIISSLPGAAVVVDEAYIEFSSSKSFIPLIKKYPNLLVMRTLSKAWGMAGLRLGCVIADERLNAVINNVLPPYPVARTAIKAAEKVIGSAAAKKKVKTLLKERAFLDKELRKIKFINKVIKSEANFIFFELDNPLKAGEYLLKKGIAVRMFNFGLRVSVGTPAENKKFLAALKAYKG